VDGVAESRKTCKIRAGQQVTVRIGRSDAVIDIVAA
jgi:ribosome-associated protein YbcJ (S4-like RNA binding protein)